jgi:hypothetical protein
MEINGTAIRSTLLGIEKVHGEEGLRTVKAALPAHVLALIEPTVLPVSMYPVEVSASIHLALRDVFGGGTSWAPSFNVGVAASRIDFTGIYRVLLRSISYEGVWDRMEIAWKRYNTQGTITWSDRRPGFACGIIRGVDGFNLGLWSSVAGRAQGLLLLSGAKGAHAEVVEGSATGARIDAHWIP